MQKKLDLDMAHNSIRAARVALEETIKQLFNNNAYAEPAPRSLSWLNRDIADVYSQIVSIECRIGDLENLENPETEGVIELKKQVETCDQGGETGAAVESAGTEAGLGEKSEPVAPAPASEEKTVKPAPKKKAPEVKQAPEVVDEDAEKAERTRICGSLFRVLKGQMDGKAARLRTEEVRDAFLGKPTTVDDITHDQHAAFIAHMQKAIDDAKGEKNA